MSAICDPKQQVRTFRTVNLSVDYRLWFYRCQQMNVDRWGEWQANYCNRFQNHCQTDCEMHVWCEYILYWMCWLLQTFCIVCVILAACCCEESNVRIEIRRTNWMGITVCFVFGFSCAKMMKSVIFYRVFSKPVNSRLVVTRSNNINEHSVHLSSHICIITFHHQQQHKQKNFRHNLFLSQWTSSSSIFAFHFLKTLLRAHC